MKENKIKKAVVLFLAAISFAGYSQDSVAVKLGHSVDKPTSFGGSIGFKLEGNIGKTNYVGLGLSYSYGWHRNY